MASTEMVVHQGQATTALTRVSILEPNNLQELQSLGQLMAASGFFQDSRSAAQACVKILAGREMGFPPIASMTGISIIDGKPATGANLLAAAMKRAGYTWTVERRDATGCKIIVSFRGKVLGPSEFLEADAKRANLLNKKNWQNWPRSMYFARSISDAARTYAPEVFAGIPPYTAEELGAENTTEDGAPVTEAQPQPMSEQSQQEPLAVVESQEVQVLFERCKKNGRWDRFAFVETASGLKKDIEEMCGTEGPYYETLAGFKMEHFGPDDVKGKKPTELCAVIKALHMKCEAIRASVEHEFPADDVADDQAGDEALRGKAAQ